MPSGKKRYLKPRELAQQSINLYELQKKQNIEKNNLVLESMGVKHLAHALFNSNKDGKTASTSKGRKKKAHGDDDDEGYIPEVDEESSSSGEDEFCRQQSHHENGEQTHHENGDPLIVTVIYEEASTEEPKKRRVWGPTIGKAVVQTIKKNEGNRILVVVLSEMRAFCGINASCVANEFGVQIRRIFPTEGFAHSWNGVDSTMKEAIMQAVKDKFQITDEDIAEDSELIEAGPNKEWPEFCDFWKRTHTSSKTGTWANLERVRDEGIASGNLLTGEELSRIVLKPSKRHIKGFGTGPRPSSYSSKSDVKRLAQEHQLQELHAKIEESKKKDEERDQEIANLKILVAQLMNGGGGNNHSSW
ncbi:hypothetical protein Dimus_000458 [Dionaea muscipula]